MKRLWVVEAHYKNGTWHIADFIGEEWSSTNYSQAQRLKRNIQECAHTHNDYWTKSKFRVKEYVRKDNNLP